MKSFTLLILLFPIYILADYCDSDKCYQSVNNAHQKLRELLNKGNKIVAIAKFPQCENVFDGILKRLENNEEELEDNYELLEKNLEILEDTFRNSSNYNKWLIGIKQKLEENPDYDELERILTKIKKRLEYFESLLLTNQNVTKTCDKTDQKYKEFDDITTDLNENYKQIEKQSKEILNRITRINNDIRKTTEETEKNYKNFQEIQIPFSVEKHLIDDLENKINQSLGNLQKNGKVLQELLKELYTNRSETIQAELKIVGNALNELQDILDIIWQILKEYGSNIPNFDDNKLLITDDLIKLIDSIDNSTIILENKLKKLEDDLEKTVKKFHKDTDKLNSIINDVSAKIMEKQQLLDAYNRFLSILLNIANNKAKIQFEIDKVRKTIDLINEKEQIKSELNDISRIYDELVKYGTDGICAVDVKFEE